MQTDRARWGAMQSSVCRWSAGPMESQGAGAPGPVRPTKPAAEGKRSRRQALFAGSGRALGLMLSLVFAIAPTVAVAQDKESEANKLFVQAREKLAKNDAEGALELLDEAEKLFAHPAIQLLKAKTQREVGRLDDAASTLDRIPAAKLPKPLKKVHDDEVAEITRLRGIQGRIAVRVEPPNAFVVIDGAQFRGGYDRWRTLGEVRIEALAPGHQPAVRTVTVVASSRVDLELKLQPLRGTVRVSVPGGMRGVEVRIDDKAQVIDDARRAGDVAAFEVELGKHEVVCVRGDKSERHTVDVALGQTHAVQCEQVGQPSSTGLRASIGWGGVAAGLGMAGYGTWGIASYFSDLETAKQNGQIAQTNKHYGGALYLASGLAIGITSWLLFVREPAATESAALHPAPSAATPLHAGD